MIVADASLLANLIIPGLDKTSAEFVLEMDADWSAPGLWQYEIRSVLLKYIRAKILTEKEGEKLMAHASNVMEEGQQDALAPAVLSAAIAYGISSYDAEYVALAESLGVPLITYDRKLVKATAGIALLAVDFITGP